MLCSVCRALYWYYILVFTSPASAEEERVEAVLVAALFFGRFCFVVFYLFWAMTDAAQMATHRLLCPPPSPSVRVLRLPAVDCLDAS